MNLPRLLSVVALVTLTGCQSAVGTHVSVAGPGEASAAITVRLDGEAADVLARDPANRELLEAALSERLGVAASRSEQGTAVEYRAPVAYLRLETLAGWTGIGRLALADLDSQVRLVADLDVPGELDRFLVDLAGDAADADAVLMAMRQLVDVRLTVTFPRHATIVATTGEHWETDGRVATYTIPVAEVSARTVSVTAELAERPGPVPYLVGGAGLVTLVWLGLRHSRRR
jgi:hypothetical protein